MVGDAFGPGGPSLGTVTAAPFANRLGVSANGLAELEANAAGPLRPGRDAVEKQQLRSYLCSGTHRRKLQFSALNAQANVGSEGFLRGPDESIARRWTGGDVGALLTNISFRAPTRSRATSRPANTHGSLIDGWPASAWTQRFTAHIRCGAQKRASFIGGPRISEPCSYYSGIRSWRVQSGIWGSRSMTPLNWPSRRKSSDPACGGGSPWNEAASAFKAVGFKNQRRRHPRARRTSVVGHERSWRTCKKKPTVAAPIPAHVKRHTSASPDASAVVVKKLW